MPKIVRFNGNLKAFASEQLGNERTLFGQVTSADDLTSQFTPEFTRGWGIVGPSDQPSLQDFNAVSYTNGQLIAYLHQMGVPEYNAAQEYYAGSITQIGTILYVSLVDGNTGNTPASSPAQWRAFLTSVPDASTTVKGIIEIATSAESVAGLSSTLAVPPSGLAAAIAALGTSTDGIAGAASNLRVSATGTNATVTASANSICVKNATNQQLVLNSVAIAINSASSGANGLDTGAIAASTWYSVWTIYNPATAATAGLLSLSATAPAMPSGYTHRARIGWMRTDGTANRYPLSFIQAGRRFQYKPAAGSNLTTYPRMAAQTTGLPLSWTPVSVSNDTPPGVASIQGFAASILTTNSGNISVAPSTATVAGGVPSFANPMPVHIDGNVTSVSIPFDFILESSNIYWCGGGGTNSNVLACTGYEDNL